MNFTPPEYCNSEGIQLFAAGVLADATDSRCPLDKLKKRLRIIQVYFSSLEESVQKFLESLGKLSGSYLTGPEEKLLSVFIRKMTV